MSRANYTMGQALGWTATILLFISIPLGIWIVSSYHEARVYTKLTGKEVSTWDAMWVQLRVQETPE